MTAGSLSAAPPVIATVPTESGDLIIESHSRDIVKLTLGGPQVSLKADEALKAADWLKRGELGPYRDSALSFVRRENELEMTLIPTDGAAAKTTRLKRDWITQLAMGLAAARQSAKNVEKGLESP